MQVFWYVFLFSGNRLRTDLNSPSDAFDVDDLLSLSQ